MSMEFIDEADRAVQTVRRIHQVRRGDLGGPRAARRKSMWAVAAEDARESPESVGDQAHSAAVRLSRIEGTVVVAHARHAQRAMRPESGQERLDHAAPTTTIPPQSETAICKLISASFISMRGARRAPGVGPLLGNRENSVAARI